ncbi:MAG TPA: hypothetical protein DDW37_10155 [Verrucomicrobiales bacterium]|jgi:hypothetical protein|nr:hypothetical protein [Verrucomicrobiales bacterium]HBI32320.1 hypothetical protein [Verrucomicrobiales bacterium]
MEKKAIAEPFKGITADGKVEKKLFEIKSTGVKTSGVKEAAQAFLKGLTADQRAKTRFPVDDNEWRRWANQHSLPRQGVSFEEMNEAQRNLAFKMIGAGLSAKGLKTTQDIMKLNHTIAELSGREGAYGYGRWAYFITIMGDPSDTKPWGFQFDGHHCIINYFILKDQVVMTPLFLGSEPVWAEKGKYKGTIVLQEEQNQALALIRSLNEQQKKKAVLKSEKDGTNTNTEAFHDNAIIPYQGIPISELTPDQKAVFLKLTGLWIGNLKEGHAKVKMEEIEKHLDRTRFAWIGKMDEDSVFYYRIHSPVVLIEFDHQRPIALGRSRTATRQHIHATVRTPNGNDYGKDLLKQHLKDHHHSEK